MDARIKVTKRQIILDIDDMTPVPFTNKDMESIADNIEDLLRKKYDVHVTQINVKDVKND
jgi:hypothetical protein